MIDTFRAATLSHKSLTNLDAGHWGSKSEVGSCSSYSPSRLRSSYSEPRKRIFKGLQCTFPFTQHF